MPEDIRRHRDTLDTPCVRIPPGNAPTSGWPLFLFLHGVGECGAAYRTHVEAATKQGFAGIAPSGPTVTSGGGRAWPRDLDATNAYLREILAIYAREDVNRASVFLCGFSQGATHAIGLLLSRPEEYLGAIVLSPGEGPPIPVALSSVDRSRPLYVTCGTREYRAFRKKTQRVAALCRRKRWPCWLETHPGGHHFPCDWDNRFPRVVRWLQSPEPLV
jgi:predicted esterase